MTDFLLNGNAMAIANGDFAIGPVTEQNQRLLLECAKGSFKASPTRCVNLFSYLEDESPDELFRGIGEQFNGDGMTVSQLMINGDGKLLIDASY